MMAAPLGNVLQLLQTLTVIVCILIARAEGTCEMGECSAPLVHGDGTPTFSPAASCYSVGSSVNVSCSGVLFGSSDIGRCVDGHWNYFSARPTCEEYFCPSPSPPDHGFEEYSSDQYVLYDTAYFSCDDGYSLASSSMAMCTGTGGWEPATPTCKANCTIPDVTNGHMSFAHGTSLQDGHTADVTCDAGFTLTGPQSVTCHDGEWEPSVQQCLRNCPSPNVANSNHAADGGELLHGEYVVVRCDVGYTSGSDLASPMTCNDGQWDSAVVCNERTDCTLPDVYGGGTPSFLPAVSCYLPGSHVNISCSGVLFGSPHASNYNYSHWNNDVPPPTCEEYFCPSPTPPDHGSEEYSRDQHVLYDTAYYLCDEGYSLTGSSMVACTGKGEWEPTTPTCNENCTIPDVTNGYMSFAHGTSLQDGQTADVTCDAGFTLAGPQLVACHDGEWKPSVQQCLRNCPSPIVANSNYATDGGAVGQGEHVVVRCDSGYTSGSGSNLSTPLTCSDGQWDSSVSCYANCKRPAFPESLQVSPEVRIDDSYYHSDVITVVCAPGYRRTHGPASGHLACDNGLWTAAPLPVCQPDNSH